MVDVQRLRRKFQPFLDGFGAILILGK